MRSLPRWIFAVLSTMALAFPALAQPDWGLQDADGAFAGLAIRNLEWKMVEGDIAHYRFDVVVGSGKYDVIRIHRIVKEQRPFQPIETLDGVLLLPGTPQFFETIFMAPLKSSVPPRDQSVVMFLAKNNIDVWGMDYGSSFVPLDETDFSALKGWGIDKDAQHTEIALTIARQIRTRTGPSAWGPYRSGWLRGWGAPEDSGRLHLLGFSYGVYVAYAVANAETQKPASLRNLKGIIPVDSSLKFEDASLRAAQCTAAVTARAQLDKGVYQVGPGTGPKFGALARSAPNDPSPLTPGLTNFQAALDRGISGGTVAGVRDASGKPLDLLYTDAWLYVDMMMAGVPYRPNQNGFDGAAVMCDDPKIADVKFDDHLREIAVPIFYVGRQMRGYYAATLTASKDTSYLIVTDPAFAHADLFWARDAQKVVWKPILDWILAHR